MEMTEIRHACYSGLRFVLPSREKYNDSANDGCLPRHLSKDSDVGDDKADDEKQHEYVVRVTREFLSI